MPASDLSQLYLNNFNLRPHLNHNQVRLCSPMCPAATFYTSCATADTSCATLNLPRHHQCSKSLASDSHAQNQMGAYYLQQTTSFLHFFIRACIPCASLGCLSLRLEGLVLQPDMPYQHVTQYSCQANNYNTCAGQNRPSPEVPGISVTA